MFYAQQCASRHRFLRSAEPDIHLQSRALKGRPRRLSLCSLPVPKQFVESLGSVISFAQSATCRTWQSAHLVHPVYFGSVLCLHEYIEQQMSMVADGMVARLAADKDAGLLPEEFDPQIVVPIIVTYLQGMWSMALVSYNRTRFERQIDLFLTSLGL
jgi:hypothetical protein